MQQAARRKESYNDAIQQNDDVKIQVVAIGQKSRNCSQMPGVQKTRQTKEYPVTKEEGGGFHQRCKGRAHTETGIYI